MAKPASPEGTLEKIRPAIIFILKFVRAFLVLFNFVIFGFSIFIFYFRGLPSPLDEKYGHLLYASFAINSALIWFHFKLYEKRKKKIPWYTFLLPSQWKTGKFAGDLVFPIALGLATSYVACVADSWNGKMLLIPELNHHQLAFYLCEAYLLFSYDFLLVTGAKK